MLRVKGMPRYHPLMTEQAPDVLRIDDQEWAIREWNGPRDGIPASEALGFATKMHGTANYSGRIDTFVVDEGRLRLHMINAHLTAEHTDFMPADGAREDVTRRSWSRVLKGDTWEREEWTSKRTLLYFSALWIPFTGRIALSRGDDELTLAFDGGTLVGRSRPAPVVPQE